MVQAERDSDEEGTPSGRGKPGRTPPNFTLGFDGADYDDGDDDNAGMDIVLPPPKPKAKRSRSRSVGVRTRTTTVKVKGLSSSPEKPAVDDEEPKTAPKDRRKSTTAKRPATPIASRRGSSSKSATTPKSIAGNTPKKVPASKPAATPRRKRTAKTPAKAKAKAPDAAGRDNSKGPSIMSEEIDQNMTEVRKFYVRPVFCLALANNAISGCLTNSDDFSVSLPKRKSPECLRICLHQDLPLFIVLRAET
jgi:hypothetical protein